MRRFLDENYIRLIRQIGEHWFLIAILLFLIFIGLKYLIDNYSPYFFEFIKLHNNSENNIEP